jgi:hypothetical protein
VAVDVAERIATFVSALEHRPSGASTPSHSTPSRAPEGA